MKVLITGVEGFIGKNLSMQLREHGGYEIIPFGRGDSIDALAAGVSAADFICHLAGVNRPDDESEFARVNTGFTQELCTLIAASNRPIPVIFASSVHAERGNPYGQSKLGAEKILLEHAEKADFPVHIFRLSHVIGKWCSPNYNSVVATFCHNIARGLPISVNDPDYQLAVVHVDDLVRSFQAIMSGEVECGPYCEVTPTYLVTVGELADTLRSFKDGRSALMIGKVGTGLERVLYSTYVSYLPPEQFSYVVPQHVDMRGVFVEMLKTIDSGQFSFFTVKPGITRGGHYHHAKTEKFLVIKGSALFRFRHILSNERHQITTTGADPVIVETVPGWAHDITNEGDDEMVVMLWANEIFDPARPDTYKSAV